MHVPEIGIKLFKVEKVSILKKKIGIKINIIPKVQKKSFNKSFFLAWFLNFKIAIQQPNNNSQTLLGVK